MYNFLVTFYVTVIVYSVLPSYAFRSDYIYIESMESFYKYHEQAASWIDAVSICKAEGAQLFYPENETEIAQVLIMLKDLGINPYKIHVGFSDLEMKGVFKTIDGRPISEVYNDWYPGYPSSGSYLHCGGLYFHDYHKLFNYYCETYNTNYICKFKQDEEKAMTSTTTKASKIEPLPVTQKTIEEVTTVSANASDRPIASLDRQGAAIIAVLEKQAADAMRRQALALETLGLAFPSLAAALHNLSTPNVTVIINPKDFEGPDLQERYSRLKKE